MINSVVLCGIYYVFYIYVLPHWRGYRIRQEIVLLDGGANTHKLVKVPLDQLEEWDSTHNPLGGLVDDAAVTYSDTSVHSHEKGATFINEPKV
jgi:hypothetical protein